MIKHRNILLPLTILILAFLLILVYVRFSSSSSRDHKEITSFEECVAAGYPVMESYPERCMTEEGKSFTRQIDQESQLPDDVREHMNQKSDFIVVDSPLAMSVVYSPLKFSGQARGGWFFEASFPVYVVNWDGLIIGQGIATAALDPNDPDSTWMTDEFVPFEGVLEFENPSWEQNFSKKGAIIFQKDNPSGLPQNDDALEIPILFAPLD